MEIFMHFVYYSSSTRQKVGQIQPLHCQLSGVSGEVAAEASISKPGHMQCDCMQQ